MTQMPGQNDAGRSAHTSAWDTIGPALEFIGDGFPEEAVRLAHQHRAEVTPHLVQALQTRMIENSECDDDMRAVALDALLVLVAAGSMTRTSVLGYCCGLLARAVEQRTSFKEDYLATTVVSAIYPLRPLEHMAEIRAAYAAGVIDPHRIALREIEALLTEELEEDGGGFVTGLQLYNDVAADMREWPCFNREPDDDSFEETLGACGYWPDTPLRPAPTKGFDEVASASLDVKPVYPVLLSIVSTSNAAFKRLS